MWVFWRSLKCSQFIVRMTKRMYTILLSLRKIPPLISLHNTHTWKVLGNGLLCFCCTSGFFSINFSYYQYSFVLEVKFESHEWSCNGTKSASIWTMAHLSLQTSQCDLWFQLQSRVRKIIQQWLFSWCCFSCSIKEDAYCLLLVLSHLFYQQLPGTPCPLNAPYVKRCPRSFTLTATYTFVSLHHNCNLNIAQIPSYTSSSYH